jgi:hypothetical protein
VPLTAADTLVTGTLTYRECLRVGCATTAAGTPVFKPIRRARVEVWDQSVVPNAQRAVVDTDDTGTFTAVVPASGVYDVTVVASSAAGQVNFENDAVTWFWRPLGMPQPGVPGGTMPRFDFAFTLRADAGHFNALDGITRGHEYAVERSAVAPGAVDETFRKTVVIPGNGVIGANTHRVGHATHIWMNSGADIFVDETVLHEYGHHLQHANGTYHAWGTFHNGCYATVVTGPACRDRMVAPGGVDTAHDRGCWVNSPELAWFEGFPDYFERMVMDFDADRALTRTSADSLAYAPGPSSCPLVASPGPHFNHHNQPITGAGVEDYVAGALRTLPASTVLGSSGTPLPRREIEEEVFRIFVDRIRAAGATVFGFRDSWNARFPTDTSWSALMALHGM